MIVVVVVVVVLSASSRPLPAACSSNAADAPRAAALVSRAAHWNAPTLGVAGGVAARLCLLLELHAHGRERGAVLGLAAVEAVVRKVSQAAALDGEALGQGYMFFYVQNSSVEEQ